MSDKYPRLSAILTVGDMRARASRALESILAQRVDDPLEVLVLDCGQPGAAPLDGADDPRVRVTKLPPGEPFGRVRATGVRQARAPVVAFVEEHSLAQPGWAEALLRAHAGPWAGVGCEMHNGTPGLGVSDAVELIYFSPFTPPAERRVSELLPGNNSSFKRDALLAYDDELEVLLLSEALLHWKLQEDGGELLLEPDAKLAHINEITWPSFMRAYYIFHRCFGHQRAEYFAWSFWKRLLYIVTSPLMPVRRLLQVLRFTARERPDRFGFVVWRLPFFLIGFTSGGLGQLVGLLFGMGKTDRLITELETNTPRAPEGY